MAPRENHLTEAKVFNCRPCNTRYTVVSGVLSACPSCGRALDPAGVSKVVEVVVQ